MFAILGRDVRSIIIGTITTIVAFEITIRAHLERITIGLRILVGPSGAIGRVLRVTIGIT